MSSERRPAPIDGGRSRHSFVKRIVDDTVIDVHAPCNEEAARSSSDKGKGVAKVARLEEVIDVDDPASWATTGPSLVCGFSSSGGKQPMLKFDGPRGVALYQQKMEVVAEEADGNAAGDTRAIPEGPTKTAVAVDEAVPVAGVEVGGDDMLGRVVAEEIGMDTVRDSASTGDKAVMGGASASGGAVAVPLAVAPLAAGMMEGVGTVWNIDAHVHRPSARSKAVLSRLPRRHRIPKFVRRAPRMTVVPVARMTAGPPTPPLSSSESEADVAHSTDEGEEMSNGGAAAGPDDTQVAGNVTESAASSPADDANGSQPSPAARERSPTVGGLPPPVMGTATASDVLAEQLSARSRNPVIFPAAFWQPGSPSVLASVQQPRAGFPPIVPPVARRDAPVGASVRSVPPPTAPPPPPLPVSEPPVADPTDDSSEEMDDDALVAAYIAPPASPLLPTTAASPRQSRPSSGKRRRANDSRALRAAAGAASSSVGVEADMPPLLLRDVHAAFRSGASSLRREITRLRVEVVVTKSQSASTLRRMDGIAAAVDERESGSGIVLERLAALDRTVQGLSARMTMASSGTAGENTSSADYVSLVAEIKVRTSCALCFSLSIDARPSPQMGYMWCRLNCSPWLATHICACQTVGTF